MPTPRHFVVFVILFAAFCAQSARSASIIISPEVAGDGVIFRLKAPKARSVVVQAQWSKETLAMAMAENGVWTATADVPSGVWEYSYLVDGLNVVDPANAASKPQYMRQKSILHVRSTPPALWDRQDVPHGTVHQHEYYATSLRRTRELWVYTPPGYERAQNTRFPLLLLQHGWGDNHRTWVEHGKLHWILDNLIARGQARPMVVVMLDGHPLGVDPWADELKRGLAMNAFSQEVKGDVFPLIASLYRVKIDRDHCGIAGLSMGGAQALGIGLSNPERFGWVGAFSAAPPNGDAANALLAVAMESKSKLRLLWIAVGKDDFLRPANEAFVSMLNGKGIDHSWQISDGNHSWPVWRRYLGEFLPLLFDDAK